MVLEREKKSPVSEKERNRFALGIKAGYVAPVKEKEGFRASRLMAAAHGQSKQHGPGKGKKFWPAEHQGGKGKGEDNGFLL